MLVAEVGGLPGEVQDRFVIIAPGCQGPGRRESFSLQLYKFKLKKGTTARKAKNF